MDPEFRQDVDAASEDDLFNMNEMTPGTAFMDRLDAHLLFIVRHSMATNLMWKRIRVVYSGKNE